MYTQCPDCQTAFQVTARVLQQAGGKVRCGGCGKAFNALDFMSEDLPGMLHDEPSAPQSDPAGDAIDDETFAEQTSALLETLDELAGPEDIRIEDTGIEWRVRDEVARASHKHGDIDDTGSIPAYSEEVPADQSAGPAALSNDGPAIQPQESLDLPESEPATLDSKELRFDDNTPLPEDFEELPESTATPRRRVDDPVGVQQELAGELQDDLELGEADDWEQLLDEVDVSIPKDGGAVSIKVEEELAAIHSELSGRSDIEPGSSPPIDDSPTADIPLYVESEDEIGIEAADEDDISLHDDDEMDEIHHESEREDSEEEIVFEEADAELDDESTAQKSLRESTGAFEKQIAVAKDEIQRQLEDGYEGAADNIDGEPQDEFADVPEGESTQPDEVVEELPVDDLGDALERELSRIADGPADEPGADEEITGDIEDEESIDIDDVMENITIADYEPKSDDEEIEDREVDHSLEKTIGGVPASLLAASSSHFETIIMEGESISGSIEKQRRAADHAAASQLEDPATLVDSYAIRRGQVRGGRRSGDPATTGMAAAVVILALVLVAQFLHANREALSTFGAFNQTLGPVYRIVGNPVTPDWDVKGWRFEATNGATDEDEEVLTISSRIINRSDKALPYPLVHVSLTDRWEEIIGSRVLEPNEYLAGDLDPSKPVAPGENFTALVTIASPAPEATGFKLNVCYRVSPGRVRCATEDFKD